MNKGGSFVYLLLKLRVLVDNTNRDRMYPSTLSSWIVILCQAFVGDTLFLLGVQLHKNWGLFTVIVLMKVLLLQLVIVLWCWVMLISLLCSSLFIADLFSLCMNNIDNCWSAIWLVSIGRSFIASCWLWRFRTPCIDLINSGKAERFLRHHDLWFYKIWWCNDLRRYVNPLSFESLCRLWGYIDSLAI